MIKFEKISNKTNDTMQDLNFGESITTVAPLINSVEETNSNLDGLILEPGSKYPTTNINNLNSCKICKNYFEAISLNLVKDQLKKYNSNINNIMDNTKIDDIIDNPSNIMSILGDEDRTNFLNWLRDNELLNTQNYYKIINDSNSLLDYININNIKDYIKYQEYYKIRLPKTNELFENEEFLNRLLLEIKENSEELIDHEEINNITETYLNQIFRQKQFLDSLQISQIYSNPQDLLQILTNNEAVLLLERVNPYLDFVTSTKIQEISKLPENSNILDYFTKEEIKGIIDKEVDLKNAVIQTLSYDEIVLMFNQFKQDLFLNDFSSLIQEAIDNYNLDEEVAYSWIIEASNYYRTK